MTLFIFGFLCCWVLFATLNILADRFSWFHTYSYIYGTTAPVLFPLAIICYLVAAIYTPWLNVFTPMLKGKFDADVQRVHMKVLHIGHFKICYDKTAKLINKIFFVWVK